MGHITEYRPSVSITAAGVVPCGGRKQFYCTSSIVQI